MANPVNRGEGQAPLSKDEVGISLNMRGSGGEGAFGWGILDGLLNEPSIRIESICATGAGALNAVALACGLASGARRGGSLTLANLWHRIARDRLFENCDQIHDDKMNVLRQLLDQVVDFKCLRASPVYVFLMIVRGGCRATRIVANRNISMDDVLAAIGTLGLTGLEEVEAASGDFKTAASTGAATGDGREATARSPVKAHDLNTFLMLHDAGRRYAPELLGNSIRAARQSATERCVNRLEETQSDFNPNRYLH
jgi:hypothetical protein